MKHYLLEKLLVAQVESLILQQGSGPANFRAIPRTAVDVCPDLWISRGGPINWPPQSPAVTPMDFSSSMVAGVKHRRLHAKRAVYRSLHRRYRFRLSLSITTVPLDVLYRALSDVR
jgi:hypothetical protein